MDDLIALLERTTPAVSAPNVGKLKRRARVRRGRRWASVVVPLVVLAGSAIALSPVAGHRDNTASAPGGTWRSTSGPLTHQIRAFPLSDGRLAVVLAGFDVDLPAEHAYFSAYDPQTDKWMYSDGAPDDGTPGSGIVAGADLLVANDTAVLVRHHNGVVSFLTELDPLERHNFPLNSMYHWRDIALPAQAGDVFDAWAWDGTTLVLARFGNDPDLPRPGSAGPPILMRWNADTDTWTQGATPPTAPRFLAATARTPHRLAVWGGDTLDPNATGSVPIPGSATEPRRAFTDGAIYDIDHDSWTYLPPEPSLADMATRGAEGLVTSSTLTLVSRQVDGSSRIVDRYENGSWHGLPSPTAQGTMFPVQPETGTIAIATTNESGPQSAQYIDGFANQWQTAPGYQLAQGPHGLLAVSATTDDPGTSAFAVWQQQGNTWTSATPAPFLNRMEPGIGVVGNQLFVIGNQQEPNVGRQQETWILDLPPSQPGAGTP